MKGTGSKNRKVRSDKKRDVKPTIDSDLYETISRLSYITNRPMKDIGADLSYEGMTSKKVLDNISVYFRRSIWVNEHLMYKGDITRAGYRVIKRKGGERERLTMRVTQPFHDRLTDLAYAMDLTVSSATAVLLERAVKDTDIVNRYIKMFVEEQLDPQRLKELKSVLKFIRKNNPYEEEITFAMFINFLVEEFKDSTKNIKQVVDAWLDDNPL